jgi:O-methyltransferase domain/Dimerisation domain
MATPVQTQGPQPEDQLMQFATGFMVSAALYSVTKLGIPDLMKGGVKPVSELARACGANEDAVYRVMRALASVGVMDECSPRNFKLTAVGDLVRSDRDDSMRDMVLWMGNKFHYDTYPEMAHSMLTGETVVEKVYGASCFGYFERDKECSDVFNAAMTTYSKMLTGPVLEAYDFSWLDGKTLVDVGGGHGYLLTNILKKHPGIHGIVFDLDHVVAGAPANIGAAGVTERCRTASGDFFAEVPAGDAYIMKNIIHDWCDEKSLSILRNCHRAGKGKTRVILVEAVLTPGNEPHFAKWLDLEMLLLPGGRERTEEDFEKLFAQAGFRLTRVSRTKSPVCVIEAEKLH